MGLGIFKPSSCGCSTKPTIIRIVEKVIEKVYSGSPNKYTIEKIIDCDGLLIALIKYDEYKNYEGKKILVFENVAEAQLRKATSIDPHFCASNHMSPIARFEPTDRGLRMAQHFVETWLRWG